MSRSCFRFCFGLPLLFGAAVACAGAENHSGRLGAFLDNYCVECHDADLKRGELDFDLLSLDRIQEKPDAWEQVLHRLVSRDMPPVEETNRPAEESYREIVGSLSEILDNVPAYPGEVPAMRRLTRTEYGNTVRDLLGVTVDVNELLPKDESSQGFDNITVGSLSSTLLNRYVNAAEVISRLAVGASAENPQVRVVRVPADQSQSRHVDGMPLGTRGGVLFDHTFPVSGEYEIEIRLTRDRNEEVEGLNGSHDVLILVDSEEHARFQVKPPPGGRDFSKVDAHLRKRIRIEGGVRQLAATFLTRSRPLLETKRMPYNAQYNKHRHPRQSPAVFQVTVSGPFTSEPGGETPGRKLIFVRNPDSPEDEELCAREIVASMMRRAFRRPVKEDEIESVLKFYGQSRAEGEAFDQGIESAIAAILVNPNFIFRIERPSSSGEMIHHLKDVELATRLSYFLWSSLPDDELLTLAENSQLSEPEVLESQVRRMLADEKAESLATNFANQWLHLRNLGSMAPDLRLFPDFDDNLRQSFVRETELFFQSIVSEDLPVTELLNADYTFLNERLARHYEIPHVLGSRFRRVALDADSRRGGLLRHGSILMVTSYANRTSPVIRGTWILENILGSPVPPPPPDIPALEDAVVSADLPMRERLAAHRADKSCAVCHNRIDPVGFAMENFDALGRWRETERNRPIDATGGLPDGRTVEGIDGLEKALLRRPEIFARSATEKLLTYAIGRGVEPGDGPAVRKVLRDAAGSNYRLSALITGIVKSVPFTMRKSP